jgi:hypothetical protein
LRPCRPWQAALTFRPDWPGWPDLSRLAPGTVGTIAQRRDVRTHFLAQAHDLGAHLGHDRARLLDERTRLRLDQSALAIPLVPLISEHLTERLVPGVKH